MQTNCPAPRKVNQMDGINEAYVILVKRFLNSIQGSELRCALDACIGRNPELDEVQIDKDYLCTWPSGTQHEVTVTVDAYACRVLCKKCRDALEKKLSNTNTGG